MERGSVEVVGVYHCLHGGLITKFQMLHLLKLLSTDGKGNQFCHYFKFGGLVTKDRICQDIVFTGKSKPPEFKFLYANCRLFPY